MNNPKVFAGLSLSIAPVPTWTPPGQDEQSLVIIMYNVIKMII